VVQVPQRHLAFPLRGGPRVKASRLLARRRRPHGLGQHPGARQLGGAGLRHPHLHQHHVPLSAQPAVHPPSRQSRRLVPPELYRPRRLARPPRHPPLREPQVGGLGLGERPRGGLREGKQDAGRVRRHRPAAPGGEHRRGPVVPLLGRRLPRGPGLLEDQRHRARRLPHRRAADAHPRLLGARRPRQYAAERNLGDRHHHRPQCVGPGRARARRGTHPGAGRQSRASYAAFRSRGGGEWGGEYARPSYARPLAGPVDGRDAPALHGGARPAERARRHHGDHRAARRLPARGGEGRAAAGEQRPRQVPRREPPRARSADGPLRQRRLDASRHRADEAGQRQRRADQPLSQRPALVRPRRRVRPLRHRRGERRVARDRLPPRHHPRQQPGVADGAPRPHHPDGRARQEPRVGRWATRPATA
jgi:hypothetical protein